MAQKWGRRNLSLVDLAPLGEREVNAGDADPLPPPPVEFNPNDPTAYDDQGGTRLGPDDDTRVEGPYAFGDEEATATSDYREILDHSAVAGRYQIEEPIGEGGMGRVFRVRHVRLGKHFALKLLRTNFAGDEKLRKLFYREARLASSLAHPNIVSMIDFGEDPSLGAFMVMELLEGEPLSVRLRREGRFGVRLALELVLQIADALHYIHQKKIVHCDIKPDNILLCEPPGTGRRQFVVKLLDFGLARVPTGGNRVSQIIDGTPEYMAPERIVGSSPQASMDIYGLGVLAYELLTGKLPFRGTLYKVMEAHVRQEPPPPSSHLKEPLDERVEALVLKSLEKDPRRRQKDMAAFIFEVRTLMDMLGYGRRRRVTITREQKIETPVREKAAMAMFQMSSLPMAAVNVDGEVVAANPAFARFLTGDKEAEVEGQDVYATKLQEVHPGFSWDVRRVHISGQPQQQVLQLLTNDGMEVRLMLYLVPGGDGVGDVHITIHTLESPHV